MGSRSFVMSAQLRARIQSAIIAGTVALVVVFATAEWPLMILVAVVGFFAALELEALFGGSSRVAAVLSVAASVGVLWLLLKVMAAPYAALAAVVLGTVGVIFRAQRGRPHAMDGLGLGWIAGPLACAMWLHQTSADASKMFSPNLLALVLVPLWLGDTAAYFVGKLIGKTPLAPTISPKKTVEGAIANLVMCIAASFVVGHLMNQGLDVPLPAIALLASGMIVGVFGQVGDLLQSALKRSVGLKDSGRVLPGHGGVLDRIDSFLFASVPASIALWLLASQSFSSF